MVEFDVLLTIHEKDFEKAEFSIESVKKYLKGYDKIHVITNKPFSYDGVISHDENDVLPIDRSKLKLKPTWIYQQLLKLFQNVTKDWFLVIDSDSFLNKPLEMFEEGKPKIFNGIYDVSQEGYFKFSEKYLNVHKAYPITFVCEIMLFNRQIINEIFYNAGYKSIEDILNLFYDKTDKEHFISEYELYGNYIEITRPEMYVKKTIYGRHWGSPFKNYWTKELVRDFILKNPDSDIISTHTWYNEFDM
jgi:hypothetical protein